MGGMVQVGSPFNGAVLHLVAEALMAAATCREGCTLEFPRGGSQAIINALVRCCPSALGRAGMSHCRTAGHDDGTACCRGIKKHGGHVLLNAHVDSILVRDGRAAGVQLSSGERVTARKAVVSNASLWDSLRLLPAGHAATAGLQQRAEVRTHSELAQPIAALHLQSTRSTTSWLQRLFTLLVMLAAHFQGGVCTCVMHLLHDAGNPSVPLLHAPALRLPGRGDGHAGAAPHCR